MLLTEQEAMAKWCPMSRVIAIAPQGAMTSSAFNRTLQATPAQVVARGAQAEVTLSLPESAQCAGSSCMMWHWVDGKNTVSGRRGFCGLTTHPLTNHLTYT